MSTEPLPERRSPRPAEPDAHLRVSGVDGEVLFDFRACRSAAVNFLRVWAESHNPAATAAEIFDGFLPAHRMPCEDLWLQP